jgi:hypothetical protein
MESKYCPKMQVTIDISSSWILINAVQDGFHEFYVFLEYSSTWLTPVGSQYTCCLKSKKIDRKDCPNSSNSKKLYLDIILVNYPVEFCRAENNLYTRGSVVGWGTMLQAERSRVRVPMKWIFFNWTNPSSRIIPLGSTQSLTEMITRNLPGG